MNSFDGWHLLMFFVGSAFGLAVIWMFYRAKARELDGAKAELKGLQEPQTIYAP